MDKFSEQGEQLCQELTRIMTRYPTQMDYLSAASKPLANLATATSALTIVSILLTINSSNILVILFAGISVLLMVGIIVLAIYIQLTIFRANFRLTRVKYHIGEYRYMDQSIFNQADIKELTQLSKLAYHGFKALQNVEWLYHHVLWRLIYSILAVVFVLIVSATFIELSSRIELFYV